MAKIAWSVTIINNPTPLKAFYSILDSIFKVALSVQATLVIIP